jgi:hypothetical protein
MRFLSVKNLSRRTLRLTPIYDAHQNRMDLFDERCAEKLHSLSKHLADIPLSIHQVPVVVGASTSE